MRTSALILTRIWQAGSFKNLLNDKGTDHAFLFLYLLTSPHAHMSGLYYLPVATIADETNIPANKIKLILNDLVSADLVRYDPVAKFVWVINMCRDQAIGGSEKDKRRKGVTSYIEKLPVTELVDVFKAYYPYFCQAPSKPLRSPIEGSRSLPYPIPIPVPSIPGRNPEGKK
jgi:hypothetical protein